MTFNILKAAALYIYICVLADMSILGEKATLSARQDCRWEWTLLRSVKQAHIEKTTICELAGKSHSLKVRRLHRPHDLYWLMDRQKEHSCIMNASQRGWSVMDCGSHPYLQASYCLPWLSRTESSCG